MKTRTGARPSLPTILLGGVILIACLFGAALNSFFFLYHNRIVPGVTIDGVAVGGMKQDAALRYLEHEPKTSKLDAPTITLRLDDAVSFSTTAAKLGQKREIEKAVSAALSVGRSGSLLKNLGELARAFRTGVAIQSSYTFSEEAIYTWTSQIAAAVNTIGEQPKAQLRHTAQPRSLTILRGKPGREVNQEQLAATLLSISSRDNHVIAVPVASTAAALTNEEYAQAVQRTTQLVGKSLQVVVDGETFTIADTQIIPLLHFPKDYRKSEVEALVATLAAKINRNPKNAEFEQKDGVVKTFVPDENGRKLDEAAAQQTLLISIRNLEAGMISESPVPLAASLTPPEKTLADLNDLGIVERIGIGTSSFQHSIPNRVHNVTLTAKRLNLALIPPDGTFSFNKTVGEVSAKTGYKQAYVISNGRTVLGDGGGVCQVSTTLFRALLNAGLPILQRRSHSYRVGYYEQDSQPGFDATVYAPSVDLQFKNDTGKAILITAKIDPKTLTMSVELWGTKDGRIATISEYRIWDKSAALPSVYQDDPSLPAGTLKQVDWSAPGAKTAFRYRVIKQSGSEEQELQNVVFRSAYQPWAAVYLRGTGTI